MGAFLVRRLVGMVLVLVAVSFVVFVVFILVPSGDPASRMAGKNPTRANIVNIRKKWGFDRPFYVQYARMMEKAGNGLGIIPGKHGPYDVLRSFGSQTDVVAQIKLIEPDMVWEHRSHG